MNTDPYKRLTRDGKTVDAITDAALSAAEKRLGKKLSVVQGSYNGGKVAASAGTHDLGGVVDLMPWDWQEVVPALRAVGFAAWYRPAIPGLWNAHIHAVLIDHGNLAPSAARQVQAYLARRNGLKDNAPDPDPGWIGSARFSWRDHVAAEKAAADKALRGKLYKAQRAARKAGRLSMRDRLKKMRLRTKR